MAIYKPSNCQPFLNSVDLTQDQWLQCEVNTSNMRVTGYKIRITCSNVAQEGQTNLIFEGEEYTRITGQDGNTGLNGSIFAVKFVTTNQEEALANPNMIYYSSTPITTIEGKSYFWVRYVNRVAVGVPNFANGYQNQPYRWEITFAQGQQDKDGHAQQPTAEWYDMIVTNGTVMGSTPNRIQTYPSKEVKTDYYIQLYKSDRELIGTRELIIGKDSSYGYIYPHEDQYTDIQIQQANFYKVFKDTNDPNVVDMNRSVMYLGNIGVDSTKARGALAQFLRDIGVVSDSNPDIPDGWQISNLQQKSAVNDYYLTQVISCPATYIPSTTRTEGGKTYYIYPAFVPLRRWYVDALNVIPTGNGEETTVDNSPIIAGADSFLMVANGFNGQVYDGELDADTGLPSGSYKGSPTWAGTPTYNGSPWNGVLEFVDAVWNIKESEKTADNQVVANQLLIRWQRPSNARKIASYINQNWFVSSPYLRNYTVPSLQTGVATEINSTILLFTPEEAIDLYGTNAQLGYGNDSTKGQIFKNGKVNISKDGIITADENGSYIRTYVRPFVGLQSGMAFQYYDSANTLHQILNFTLSNTNIEDDWNPWYIIYPIKEGDNLSALVPDKTRYKITTYFKTSDENPFYAYSTPTVGIQFNSRWVSTRSGGSYFPRKDTDGNIIQDGITEPATDSSFWTVPFRFIEVNGSYVQAQNKSWKNFTWSLYDYNFNITQTLDTQYSGEIFAFFEGLQDGHKYQIILTMEDELGNMLTATCDFQCILPNETNEDLFPLTLQENCETQSVDIDFVQNGVAIPNALMDGTGEYYQNISFLSFKQQSPYGVYIPNGPYYKDFTFLVKEAPQNSMLERFGVKEENARAIFRTKSDNILPCGLEYSYAELPLAKNSEGNGAIDVLSGPISNVVTFNSQHKLNPRFEGIVFNYSIDLYPDRQEDTKVALYVKLSKSVQSENIKLLDGRNKTVYNKNRNLLLGFYQELKTYKNNEQEIEQGNIINQVDIKIINSSLKNSPVNQWRQGKKIVWAYAQNGEIPSDAKGKELLDYDYLDTTTVYDLQKFPDSLKYVNDIENEEGVPCLHKRFIELSYFIPSDINGNQSLPFPLGSEDSTSFPTVWRDNQALLVTMANGITINVNQEQKLNIWSFEEDKLQWEDNRGRGNLFIPQSVNIPKGDAEGIFTGMGNNHDGRQEISTKWLLFNCVLNNFDREENTIAESPSQNVQCYIGNVNINTDSTTN